MHRIIIVEDDENIREAVLYALKASEFDTAGYESAEGLYADIYSEAHKVALVILDVMLPGDDGLTILKKLRNSAETAGLPVIMLTARGSEFDRVKGLDLGADDYIVKPFSVMELISRVNAVLRRTTQTQASAQTPTPPAMRSPEQATTPPVASTSAQTPTSAQTREYIPPLTPTLSPASTNTTAESAAPGDAADSEHIILAYENLLLDHSKRIVSVGAKNVALTFKEYELLYYMLVNRGLALSRERIIEAVWGYDFEGESRTLDMHIRTLRQKLGPAGGYIGTIRNYGYRLGE